MVLAQPLPVNLQQRAANSFGFGVMSKLLLRIGLLVEISRGRHRLAAFLGKGGDLAQVVNGAAGVGRLPVIGAEGLLTGREDLPGRLDSLGELAGTLELVDRLGERFDLPGIVALQDLRRSLGRLLLISSGRLAQAASTSAARIPGKIGGQMAVGM